MIWFKRMVILGVFWCASFSAAAATADDGAELRRLALIVASNDGGSDRPRLRHAITDAESFGKVLHELGGVKSGDLRLVKEPTVASLKKEIARFTKNVSAASDDAKRVEVIVYYSGHSDRRGLLLEGELYSYKSLRARLDELSADVRLVILDSCASGEMTRTKGGRRRPPFLSDDSSLVKGYAVLTSSSADEAAQESDKLGASFFTHFLNSGLRGAADVNADSRITLNEAYQFAFHETLARTEKTSAGAQHAAYDMELSGRGDLVLTDVRQTASTLVLADDLDGRVYVREQGGELAVELDKRAGKTITLGLPAGKYKLVVAGKSVLAAQIELEQGASETLDAGDFETVDAEDVRVRGAAENTEAAEWTSEVPVSLARQFHLGAGTAELRLGAGVVHSTNPDGGLDLSVDFLFRRGLSNRLSYVFPLILSGQIWQSDNAQWVLSGGLDGLGYSSLEGVIVSAGVASGFQYRLTEGLALNLGASISANHRWGVQRSEWWAGGLASATWQVDERVSGGIGVGYSRSQGSPGVSSWEANIDTSTYRPDDTLVFGAVGGRAIGSAPLLQVRLWGGLHLYESSKVRIAPETFEVFEHSHVLGISWYYETGD